ncbi:Lateral organ boundaries (LOB) domain-containing protein [Klebsormidium nitens]|uniref:Lateral organ boundaries (LOB) domain-containing protein n=1 Tax=Klebsormidium nitens TaxID=105231 RepID=A0A1Y1IAR0_KLENI|nr:Lateral organ boundaries (LOB) domain-containing protein [Klebsormidium nitens]|eukprot:GAQ85797.1 Lateral organ boundaries (LOB) domain-containing protein [Klebsormidium nitens]
MQKRSSIGLFPAFGLSCDNLDTLSGGRMTSSDKDGGSQGPQPTTSGQQEARSPCAACKFLRRKCTDECLFAPHFPQSEKEKFQSLHRCYGAANIIKLLSGLPKDLRGDALQSLAYEAQARIVDPVYGCVGAVAILQRQNEKLKTELAQERASVAKLTQMRSQSPSSSQQTKRSRTPPLVCQSSLNSLAAPTPVHPMALVTSRFAPQIPNSTLEFLLAELTRTHSPTPEVGSPTSAQTTNSPSSYTFDSSSTLETNAVLDFDPFDIPASAKRARLAPTGGAAPLPAGLAKLESDRFDMRFGSPIGPLEMSVFRAEYS